MKEDSASSTAFTVLQGVLLSAQSPAYGALISDATRQAGQKILQATPEGRKRLDQISSPVFRTLAPWAEKILMPGISKHYVIRKTFFEKAARQAIADGYQQIINLGAGFDVLCWTLHREAPNVTFIEIDHPATSAVKQQAIQGQSPQDRQDDNIHFLAIDLAEHSLASALGAFEAFKADQKTLFLCEGVLMYLPLQAVESLFSAIKALTGPGSRLAFTAVSPIGSPNNNTGWLLRTYLSLKNEPLAWTLEQADLAGFVRKQGYTLLDHGDTASLLARYLPQGAPGPLHRGEFMALTEANP